MSAWAIYCIWGGGGRDRDETERDEGTMEVGITYMYM